MAKIYTMGEIMIRLSTANHQRFIQANNFDACYGGGEANVAVSLANYGHQACFISKVPANEIGKAACASLQKYGVNTTNVCFGGERLGIYYLEVGASFRPSKVIYDRKNSSFSLSTKEDFDFNEIFKDAKWFHFSGITPALSKSMVEIIKGACKEAKKKNITISCDLNYRKNLWTPKEAQNVMIPLMEYVDVCIGNEEDAMHCLGFIPANSDVKTGKIDIDGYKEMLIKLKERFGFKVVATTLRESYSANKNGWSALLYDGDFHQSKRYEIDFIIDRVGAGDSFCGGLIHGLLTMDKRNALEFAVAASALKHTINGDYNLVTIDEINSLINGDSSGRVIR